MRAFGLVLVMLLVAACGGSTATPTPTATPVAATPEAPRNDRTEAEMATLMQESIMIVFADEPQPEWWPYLGMDGDQPDVEVSVNSLYVVANGIDPDLANRMCRDIAAVVYDGDAQPIGIRHVHVMSRGEMVGDCNSAT